MNRAKGLILDTHIWIWWVNQDKKLLASLREHIDKADYIAISAVSVYELIQAVERGRLVLTLETETWLQAATIEADISVIPVTAQIAQIAGGLPRIHGDPIDRLIIATALVTTDMLVSVDRKFVGYPSLSNLLITR